MDLYQFVHRNVQCSEGSQHKQDVGHEAGELVLEDKNASRHRAN